MPSTELDPQIYHEQLKEEVKRLLDSGKEVEEVIKFARESQLQYLFRNRVASGLLPAATAPVSPEPQCIHLGERTGVRVKVSCVSCGNHRQIEHVAYKCDIHNRCLRKYSGPWDEDHNIEASIYKLCANCQDKQLP